MYLNYNFAFKNSKLKEWDRPSPPNILASDASFNKKVIYLYTVFKNNAWLFYPPSFILLISFGLQIYNFYPNNLIKKNKTFHNQFTIAENKLKSFESTKQIYKRNMRDFEGNFTEATNSFLFAYYLQNSVPKGVQLNNYSYSDNGFDIVASAYSLDALNEFLALLIESPVIQRNSVSIDKLLRQESSLDNESSISINYQLAIYGQVEKINIKQRESFYIDSKAEGLLRKLQRFNELKNDLRK
tara:strand:+ start:302 stop:1027 length:726 start_codon:yes stop_codon:yes gene_type:complete